MSRREEILTDDVHLVRGYIDRKLATLNGLITPKQEEEVKADFFNFSTNHLLDELVTITKEYPKDGMMDVQVSADFIVMKRKDFDELINLKNE